MTNPPGAMPPLPEPTVLAWLEERRDNCRRIATAKTGPDAAGWIEDAGLFEAARTLIARLAELQAQNEAQKDEWLSWEAKRKDFERDAARFRAAISLEDNCDALAFAVMNNAPDVAAIRDEFDAAIAAKD